VPAMVQQHRRPPDVALARDERHCPYQSALCCLLRLHAAGIIAHTRAGTGAHLPRFIKEEFDGSFKSGLPAARLLAAALRRLRPQPSSGFQLPAASWRGSCPACGVRRITRTAAHRVDLVLPEVPVRHWVLSPPIPRRVLLAAAGIKADEGQGGAFTLIQRFGSAADLTRHLHCLVLDGVYRCGTNGTPARSGFHEAGAPTAVHAAAGGAGAATQVAPHQGYDGVLAPTSKLRSLVLPPEPPVQARCTASAGRLLKLAFDVGMQRCPHCSGDELMSIAAILKLRWTGKS
jgi:Putative transposase